MCPTEGCYAAPCPGDPGMGWASHTRRGVRALKLTLHVLLECGSTLSSLWPQSWKEEVGMPSPGVGQPQRPLKHWAIRRMGRQGNFGAHIRT